MVVVQSAMFYVFAIVLIVGAVRVVSAQNPVHSVLFLVLAFLNAAGLFLLVGAEFLAMMQVIIYVGAVAVLFLFVVMMLDIRLVHLQEGLLYYLPLGGLVGVTLLVELIIVISLWEVVPNSEPLLVTANNNMLTTLKTTNTEALGLVLYTDYLYLFQTSGILLLVAMLGAIVLTLRSRSGIQKQNVARQHIRTKINSLEIRKVQVKEGI